MFCCCVYYVVLFAEYGQAVVARPVAVNGCWRVHVKQTQGGCIRHYHVLCEPV